MQKSSFPKVLILGGHGMVGQSLYRYFLSKKNTTIYQTSRKTSQKDLIYFDAYQSDSLKMVINKIKNVDLVINCIGILKNNISVKDHIYINSYFPHLLEDHAEEMNFNLVHISTDAVYANLSKHVTEDDSPNPNSLYGQTKLLGELTGNKSITLRTSILGIDKYKSSGLLNWVIDNSGTDIKGFTNQRWNGCTTLQLAQFIEKIVAKNNFSTLQECSNIFHFAPIQTTTKYMIIKNFCEELNLKTRVVKDQGGKVTRELDTKYGNILSSYYQKSSIASALHDLVLFENLKQ